MLKHSPEIQDLLAECAVSTKATAKILFNERFYAPFSSLHDQIFDLIDSGAPRIVIAAPRGIGKTSIVGLALAARKILFRDARFLLYVSNSATSAERQTENLKLELLSNKLVKDLWGDTRVRAGDGTDDSFSRKSWTAFDHTLVYPRGSGQQVRGLLYKNYRPDYLIIDDLEDTDTIENEEVRTKRLHWFNADLLKATSRLESNWQIIYIDTLKHQDSLLQRLIDSPDWESLVLSICDDQLRSNAPNFVSDEEVKKEYDYYKNMGLLDVFYREFRNIPISTEDAVFMQKYFKYYEDPDLEASEAEVENIIIVDPAKTVKMHSAESAIVGWGIDRASAKLYFRDCTSRRMHPDELYNEIFNMAARLRARVVGIEVTSLNEFITQPLKNEMFKRGLFFEIVELKPRAKKEERIAALAPYYRQGHIYHNPNCCQQLEQQLLAFPRSKLIDVADAAAYVVEMLEIGERYFEPPSFGDSETEYSILEDMDEGPLDNWRYSGV